MSTRQVACRLNISQTSAFAILQENKENIDVHRAGRPRKLTIRDAEMARLMLKRHEARTAVQATKLLNKRLSEPVSVPTVRRGLRDI
ncbi:hypothetical protein BGZ73_001614, partial [Actinomortierella ambigua]